MTELSAPTSWHDTALVFTTHHGAALDAANVRKMFKRVAPEPGSETAGPPANCAPHSSACSATTASASKKSPASPDTPPPAPPKSSTAANYGPSSPPAPKSWTNSSQQTSHPNHPSSHPKPLQAAVDHRLPDLPDGKPWPSSRSGKPPPNVTIRGRHQLQIADSAFENLQQQASRTAPISTIPVRSRAQLGKGVRRPRR